MSKYPHHRTDVQQTAADVKVARRLLDAGNVEWIWRIGLFIAVVAGNWLNSKYVARPDFTQLQSIVAEIADSQKQEHFQMLANTTELADHEARLRKQEDKAMTASEFLSIPPAAANVSVAARSN
jgi:muconolactone delta-isomerase